MFRFRRNSAALLAALAWLVSTLALTAQTTPPAAAPANASPAELHATAARQLREAIERRYSHHETRRVDWAERWPQFEPRLLAAESPRAFAIAAGELLAATGDPHLWLTEAGQIVPAFRRAAALNLNLRLLPKLIDGWSQRHAVVASGRAAPRVGYVAIHSWERRHAPQSVAAALAALADLRDLPALIVDVRANAGGDETLAREFAGCFVAQRVAYAAHVVRDPATGRFSAPAQRWLEPNPRHPRYVGRVAVLAGRHTLSSAESFLLMMRQVSGAQLVGERSYGSSGNPQPLALANGVTVLIPSWRTLLPDGTELETHGVAPDHEVKWDAALADTRDPVIERAVALLSAP